MGMITDKQWLLELIPDYWLGSNGEQKFLADMQVDYRGNCVKKLMKMKEAFKDVESDGEYYGLLEIINNKLAEFEALEAEEPEGLPGTWGEQ